ncbi:MAG: hypothetical protein AB7N99_08990 [Simkaniaceae bacterium]
MGTVYQTNFRSKEFMLFSAATGIVYSAIISKYSLLKQTTLHVQMGALALAAVAGCQILGTTRREKQYFCTAVPILVIGVATIFTNETLKTKVISAAILSFTQLLNGKICTEVVQVQVGRSKPIVEDRTLGDITVEEMNQDPYKIRGFDKMVQGPWLQKQLRDYCQGKASFVDAVICQDMIRFLDLDHALTENEDGLPKIVLINNKMHYSVVVYDPADQHIYRFNSLSTEVNPLEEQVINKMKALLPVQGEVVSNQRPHQKDADGWSCAFRVKYFVEHFLNGSGMDDFDAAPLPPESLARRLSAYYHFLKDEMTKIPQEFVLFYQVSLDEKTPQVLKNLLKIACRNGHQAKQELRKITEARGQITCILVKLWELEQQTPGSMLDCVKEMGDFNDNQRRFLDGTLNQMDWQREGISGLFRQVYLDYHKHVISPD